VNALQIAPGLPYCGSPPFPGELLSRFNLDPVLLIVLVSLAALHLRAARAGSHRRAALAGWLIATAAFVSPLCALSVSLFSARVAQHMILVLLAAPLIALALPPARSQRFKFRLWCSAVTFFAALWFWHMPVPYDATFSSTTSYWLMHLTLFGAAIALWRELLHHPLAQLADALVVGALTSMQMGLLGAVLTFASHPLFLSHLTTSAAWGLSALRDQQLGGLFMWVPGIALFLFAAIRSLNRLWTELDTEKTA
jgi:putative membrane protein